MFVINSIDLREEEKAERDILDEPGSDDKYPCRYVRFDYGTTRQNAKIVFGTTYNKDTHEKSFYLSDFGDTSDNDTWYELTSIKFANGLLDVYVRDGLDAVKGKMV